LFFPHRNNARSTIRTNLLKNLGYKVGVLSRGYGRRSSGYKLVSKGEEILTSVEECGGYY
jgi:tetraacyldisaccharide-1-P 4'-kinase